MKSSKIDGVPFCSRNELSVDIFLACLDFLIFGFLIVYTEWNPLYLAAGIGVFYIIEVLLIGIGRRSHLSIAPVSDVVELLTQKSSDLMKLTDDPVILFDRMGTILWYNRSAADLIEDGASLVLHNVSEVFCEEFDVASPIRETVVSGHTFSLEFFTFSDEGEGIFAVMLKDIEETAKIRKQYEDERLAVAYIAIDNVEDILQYVHDKFRDAVSSVDEKLKAFAKEMNGFIKNYDNDKYVLMIDSAHLAKCVANRFAILDEIRDTRIGDGFSVTVSIGVSAVGETFAERELSAREAIDLALQRGGDQVVYKTEDSIEYYGGRTKSVYKKSNVRSRTFTNQLTTLMARADNVLIMGHRFGDFDSFGASVGIARLGISLGVKVNIAIDLRDKNLVPCVQTMERIPAFSSVFVDNAEGLDLVRKDTLVVLCDVNTPERAQFSDIALKASKLVILDHHRKIDAIPGNVVLSYIEPSASSASELACEMLSSSISSQNITKEEAEMLLAGIFLDTKQFTRNTGTRTFGAAQYLRSLGAGLNEVYDRFKTDPEDLSKESRFLTNITIYRDIFAISCCDGETNESFRIVASKAADKMLSLKNVAASFSIAHIGNQIHISGRSNGSVNVQLILEKLGGGGHFDVAGAQINAESPLVVLTSLKEAIDEYLDE